MRRIGFMVLAAAGALGIAAATMGASDEVEQKSVPAAAFEMKCSISSCEMPDRK